MTDIHVVSTNFAGTTSAIHKVPSN